MSAHRASPAERLVASLVVVPLGLGAALIDELPSTVAQIQQRLALARFIGKMAVDRGTDELKRRLGGGHEPSPDTEPESAREPVADVEPVAVDVVDAHELALPDYDQLPAAHIVGKLAGLTAGERDDIEAYETAHRHRRTVLGKLDQIRRDGPA